MHRRLAWPWILAALAAACSHEPGLAQDQTTTPSPVVVRGAAETSPAPRRPTPFVFILSPDNGGRAGNPVTVRFAAGGAVETISFEVDGSPSDRAPIAASLGSYALELPGLDEPHQVVLRGLDARGEAVATDGVRVIPESCSAPDQAGFNHYTLAAIHDEGAWPKTGAHRYCWERYGERCQGHWGAVRDASYAGVPVLEGGGDCYCSGHTLELFLRAYRLWQLDHGVPESAPFEVGGKDLLAADIDPLQRQGSVFYQYWQGFGVTREASAAAAFDAFGIGDIVQDWDAVLPGDYLNFTRRSGNGHAVVFIAWVVEKGVRVGIRYYGCNRRGDSCPDPRDPHNTPGVSGPSYNTEYFLGHGGWILPGRVWFGRPALPTTAH